MFYLYLMYTRSLIILLFFAIAPARGQVASSCVVPDTIRLTHDRDARDMALRRMYEVSSPDTIRIEVPQAQIDTILRGLAAIYNLDTALQADSVFKHWCIHTQVGFAKKEIHVQVDTTYAWARQWAALNPYTYYYDLDHFLYIHGFSFYNYYSHSLFEDMNNWAVLKTTHVLNMQSFADSILLFPGVRSVDIQWPVGSGNILVFQDSINTFTFYKGWGDCPMGCTTGKRWKYKVDDTCAVTLVSVFKHGDEAYPPYPDCTYHPVIDPPPPPVGVQSARGPMEVAVYPNPAKNVLHIVPAQPGEELRYAITNVMGQTVATGAFRYHCAVGILHLPAGPYLVTVITATGEAVYNRIIKN